MCVLYSVEYTGMTFKPATVLNRHCVDIIHWIRTYRPSQGHVVYCKQLGHWVIHTAIRRVLVCIPVYFGQCQHRRCCKYVVIVCLWHAIYYEEELIGLLFWYTLYGSRPIRTIACPTYKYVWRFFADNYWYVAMYVCFCVGGYCFRSVTRGSVGPSVWPSLKWSDIG